MRLLHFLCVVSFVFIALNCHKDDAVSVENKPITFSGKVVDSSGVSISGVGVHYIFDLVHKKMESIQNTNPSTIIKFTIPESGPVRVTIIRWYSRDSIETVVDEQREKGTYSVSIDNLMLTNGFYIAQLFTTSTFSEQVFLISNNSASDLTAKNPLAKTDSSGTFSFSPGVFAIGMPVVTLFSDGITYDTTYVSNTIQLVLYKSGYKTLTKSITVDGSKDYNQTYILEKQ